ncbi:kinesin motor domain containing protein [Stylonychia lemnae]|uniref:Kinesin-like protein n=1 Tax=Stylonychia lemnae TaxID=5949 RepID=A0A078APZ5_STYLE|nr:kinesin motor domain containing protein [Stylonychia lemnae]|eukprot:CDW83018.1 kinesin motor domain containing protein [Stylonychia lemnae]
MEGYDYALFEQKTLNGKHYSMSPITQQKQNVGLAVRTIREFFKQKQNIKDHIRENFQFSVSFFQIYNERVYDLLNFNGSSTATVPGGRKYLSQQNDLKVRWNNKDQFVVENLYTYECLNSKEAIALYNQGIKNKVVSSHKMNHASSRSHCIFSIQVDQYSTDKNPQIISSSKMFLVDLAGSERISFIGDIDKETQKETIQINKSLMTLRKCIGALSSQTIDDQKHVPYRECKLTSILKQSLGGNCYCLMIACVSPSDYNYEENIQTLNYAMKTNNIKNLPIKNKDLDMSAIEKLKQYNKKLERLPITRYDHNSLITDKAKYLADSFEIVKDEFSRSGLEKFSRIENQRSEQRKCAALRIAQTKFQPNQITSIAITRNQQYPLYQHPQATQDFPDQFYSANNGNFNEYKDIEKKIFDNRQKIVELKKVLIPFGSTSNPINSNFENSIIASSPEYQSNANSASIKSNNNYENFSLMNRNIPRINDSRDFIRHHDEYTIPSSSINKTFDNKSMLHQQLNRSPPKNIIVNKLPNGASSLLFKNIDLNLKESETQSNKDARIEQNMKFIINNPRQNRDNFDQRSRTPNQGQIMQYKEKQMQGQVQEGTQKYQQNDGSKSSKMLQNPKVNDLQLKIKKRIIDEDFATR